MHCSRRSFCMLPITVKFLHSSDSKIDACFVFADLPLSPWSQQPTCKSSEIVWLTRLTDLNTLLLAPCCCVVVWLICFQLAFVVSTVEKVAHAGTENTIRNTADTCLDDQSQSIVFDFFLATRFDGECFPLETILPRSHLLQFSQIIASQSSATLPARIRINENQSDLQKPTQEKLVRFLFYYFSKFNLLFRCIFVWVLFSVVLLAYVHSIAATVHLLRLNSLCKYRSFSPFHVYLAFAWSSVTIKQQLQRRRHPQPKLYRLHPAVRENFHLLLMYSDRDSFSLSLPDLFVFLLCFLLHLPRCSSAYTNAQSICCRLFCSFLARCFVEQCTNILTIDLSIFFMSDSMSIIEVLKKEQTESTSLHRRSVFFSRVLMFIWFLSSLSTTSHTFVVYHEFSFLSLSLSLCLFMALRSSRSRLLNTEINLYLLVNARAFHSIISSVRDPSARHVPWQCRNLIATKRATVFILRTMDNSFICKDMKVKQRRFFFLAAYWCCSHYAQRLSLGIRNNEKQTQQHRNWSMYKIVKRLTQNWPAVRSN